MLIAGLAVQLAWPAPQSTDPAAAARRAAPPAPPPSAVLPLDYPQVLARPIFTPTRGAAADAGGDSASASLSDYTLSGVARVGGGSLAVFRGAAGDVKSLRLGQALVGWRLVAVKPDSVVLQQGEVTREVRVAASAAPKPGVQ